MYKLSDELTTDRLFNQLAEDWKGKCLAASDKRSAAAAINVLRVLTSTQIGWHHRNQTLPVILYQASRGY